MGYWISDIFFKIRYKAMDYILRFYWILKLGRLGNGSFIRSRTRIIGNPRRIRIGNNFKVYEDCIIAVGKGEIEIGDNGLLGVGTYINCGNEKLKIGNGVAIAPFCKIFTYSHHYNSTNGIINTYKTGDVTIEDNVLIGTNSIVLPGITIGRSSIVAANSLIIKDIEPHSIVGGSPAKFIKMNKE